MGQAYHPQFGAVDVLERLQQDIDTLVGAHQPKAEDHRALHAPSSRGRGLSTGQPGEVVERSVGDHVHAVGVGPETIHQLGGPGAGVHHQRVHSRHQPAGDRLARAARPAAACCAR